MAKRTETVDKSIFFGVLQWNDKDNKPVDVIKVFKRIQALPFKDGSRYFETTTGQRLEIILRGDPHDGHPIYGNMGDSRQINLPFMEDVGSVSPLPMKKGAGLYDAMHFVIRKNQREHWIIAYEFNIYAPRVSAINQYIMNKFSDMVYRPLIESVAGESIERTLKKLQTIKKISMGIYAGVSVADLSSGLGDAVKALKNENDYEHIDISIRAKRGKTPLGGKIVDNIIPFFKSGKAAGAMDHFYVSGINRMGESEQVNLMDIYLKETRPVRRARSDYRFINSDDMYAALDDAYAENRSRLERL